MQRRATVCGNKIGTTMAAVDRLAVILPSDRATGHSLAVLQMLALKLSALFGGSLLALFAASLAVEDQRHFVACRASGASADACLLQISGR